MVGKDLPVVVTGVTVRWASPRFGKPHSQKPSDMGILCNPNPISLGFGEWGAHITVTVAFAKEKYNGFSLIIFERFKSILTVSWIVCLTHTCSLT